MATPSNTVTYHCRDLPLRDAILAIIEPLGLRLVVNGETLCIELGDPEKFWGYGRSGVLLPSYCVFGLVKNHGWHVLDKEIHLRDVIELEDASMSPEEIHVALTNPDIRMGKANPVSMSLRLLLDDTTGKLNRVVNDGDIIIVMTSEEAAKNNPRPTNVVGVSYRTPTSSRVAEARSPELQQIISDWTDASAQTNPLKGTVFRRIYDLTRETESVSKGELLFESPLKWSIKFLPVAITDKMAEQREQGKAASKKRRDGRPFELVPSEAETWTRNDGKLVAFNGNDGSNFTIELPSDFQGGGFTDRLLLLPLQIGPHSLGSIWNFDSNASSSSVPEYNGTAGLLESRVRWVDQQFDISLIKPIRPESKVAFLKILPRSGKDSEMWSSILVILDLQTHLPSAVQITDPAGTKVTVYSYSGVGAISNNIECEFFNFPPKSSTAATVDAVTEENAAAHNSIPSTKTELAARAARTATIGIPEQRETISRLPNEDDPAKFMVKIYGAVRVPGTYVFDADIDCKLLDAIAIAGGLSDDAGKTITVKRKHDDGSATLIQVNRVEVAQNQNNSNIILAPEDVVVVNRAEEDEAVAEPNAAVAPRLVLCSYPVADLIVRTPRTIETAVTRPETSSAAATKGIADVPEAFPVPQTAQPPAGRESIRGYTKADFAPLVELIKASVEPESWDKTIIVEEIEVAALVIRQTEKAHGEIATLLSSLRNAQEAYVQITSLLVKLTTEEQRKVIEEHNTLHSLAGGMKWTLLTPKRSETLTKALLEQKPDVISSPRILTISGQSAMIMVGSMDKNVFSGLKMKVTPQLVPDSAIIRLQHAVSIGTDRQPGESNDTKFSASSFALVAQDQGNAGSVMHESLVGSGQTLLLLIERPSSNDATKSVDRYLLLLTPEHVKVEEEKVEQLPVPK